MRRATVLFCDKNKREKREKKQNNEGEKTITNKNRYDQKSEQSLKISIFLEEKKSRDIVQIRKRVGGELKKR